jgi:dTMP kinase
MFITFEGVDGSGKTTQVRELIPFLSDQDYDAKKVREPGGTVIGDEIRRLLLQDFDNAELHPRGELLLFCASRAQLIADVIQPHLEGGGVVISDRYIDSTYAYQGYGHGINLKTLKQINTFATGGLLPDVTFFLDIEPETALKRRAEGMLFGEEWNRMDAKELAFHQRVYTGYKELMLAEPARFVRINADQPQPTVQQAIRAAIAEWLPLKRPTKG